MTEILDPGALIALERGDQRMWRHLKAVLRAETPARTHGGVVAQVWPGGTGGQLRLAVACYSGASQRGPGSLRSGLGGL